MHGDDSGLAVAVVGASGAVGREMVAVLQQRKFPFGSLRLLATERSLGTSLTVRGRDCPVDALDPAVFEEVDLALFSAGAGPSRELAPQAVDAGCIVIDNSSAWRNDPAVPLVVPEVNPDELAGYRETGIIANPNCSTVQLVVALKPLADEVGLRRVVVTTFQSVSGAGNRGIAELSGQVTKLLNGLPIEPDVHPHQMAFNCIPQIGEFRDDGYTTEEWKLVSETRRILRLPDLEVSPTAVRVPVFCGHGEAVSVHTEVPITAERARELLAAAPGVELLDDPGRSVYPMPVHATGKDAVFVGRVRNDPFRPDVLNLWIVADNMRKGAALNAVQIAELLQEESW